MIHTVYLGLGSNSDDAGRRLSLARDGLAELPGLVLAQASPIYMTEPQDYADQPWFFNQVLEVRAPDWAPTALMQALLQLESRLGRVRSPDPALRFGPRCIDIDMLLFDDVEQDDPICLLPHPRLVRRAFWLVPLRDIAPQLCIRGRSLDELLAGLDWRVEGRIIHQTQ